MEASLPRAAYCDAATFAEERERVWAHSWVCVCRSSEVGEEPGSFRLADVVGEAVLLVRDGAGSMAAFANRCMHRGTELVDTTVAQQAACFDAVIRCPYHFWTYSFDGGLRSSPWVTIDDPAPFALRRYDIAEWGGFVFVRLVPGGASLGEELGPIAHRVRRYPLEQLAIGATMTYDVGANWKVVAENYNECYHCGPVHPELCDVVPAFRVRGGGELDWERGIPHRDGADTYTLSGTSNRASFPGLDAAERSNHFGELIYPNLMLSLSRDHIAAFLLHPIAADSTRIDCHVLFHPDEMTKAAFDPSDAADFWDVVNRQDWAICGRVQRGMAGRSFVRGWFAPMEDPSLDIRRWWTARMEPEPER